MALTARQRIALAAIVLIYLLLSVATVLTARPETDESVYANPGYNLAYNGHSGTNLYQLGEFAPVSMASRTYWQPPLYFVITAIWYKLVGFSLTTTRLLSVLSGLVVILSWYVFSRRLMRSDSAAVVVATIVSVDYYLLMASGRGRMDLLCTAFGSAALAFYMTLRENRPVVAVFGSHALAALSFLVHPCGLAYAAVLCIVTLWLDRQRIGFGWIITAGAAYTVCFTPWILFILQDVQAWREQMDRILYLTERMFQPENFSSNRFIRYLQQEIVFRYIGPYGLAPGASLAGRFKAMVLLVYLTAVVGLLLLPRFRTNRNLRLFPLMFLAAFLIIAEASPSKFYYYLPHTSTIMAASAALFLWYLPLPRKLVGGMLLLVAVLQVAGIAAGIRQNALARSYKPAIDAIVRNSRPGALVMGSGELWFPLANQRTVLHDPALGDQSGLRPEVFVMDPYYRGRHSADRTSDPARFQHIENLIGQSSMVYADDYYQVYKVPQPDSVW
jgi:4-amino-4-deoxy-L-arabinose transferase-like glycosyltransferase